MKKTSIIKTLSNLIRSKKIAVFVSLIIIGIMGGIYYMYEEYRYEVKPMLTDEDIANKKEMQRTKEEKDRDEKQVRLISIKNEIKKLNPNFKDDDEEFRYLDLPNEDLDKVISKYEEIKKTLIDKNTEEELNRKKNKEQKKSIYKTDIYN